MEKLLENAFTDHQLKIAGMVADGKNSKMIAEELGISRNTVETHLYNIKKIAGANNAPHLVAKLLREKLID